MPRKQPKQPQLSHEEITMLLLEYKIQDLTYIEEEDSFYLYKDGYLTFMDPGRALIRYMTLKLIELKQEQIIPPNYSITPNLTRSITDQCKALTENVHQSIDSNYLAFNDGMLLDTSSTAFNLVPATRDLPAFIHFPYPSTILKDPTPPHKFLQFLKEITLEDPELIEFLQLLIGYCLLDSTKAECAFFFFGQGQNGKTKLLDIIKSLLPKNLISTDSIQDLTTNRFRTANLVGKRLNLVGEEESKYLNSALFKQITGGDAVSAERKFHGAFTFTPKVKLIASTNDIPTFNAVDKAMRRRLMIIPFDYEVPEHKKDPNVATNIIHTEKPQIIAWALAGARELIDRNFKFPLPQRMRQASKEQEERTSSAIQFFNDNFDITKNHDDIYPKNHLYTTYKYWCDDENKKPQSRSRFLKELEQRYGKEGAGFPHAPIWDPTTKTMSRSLTGVKPKSDPTSYVNNNRPTHTVPL